MGLEKRENNTTWASILSSDGTIRVRSAESNPEAVRRDYELKDGTKGFKYELVYNNLRGHINDLGFKPGEYGNQLLITIDDVTLAISTESKFADDILKKLPNVDFSKDVNFIPYVFSDDKSKEKKGVTVYQDLGDVRAAKLTNFFYDSATKKSKDGYPEFPSEEERKKMDKDDWKIYFIKCRKFLQKYTEENVVPKIEPKHAVITTNDEDPGVDIEDIPMA